jgi:hypothetical protein
MVVSLNCHMRSGAGVARYRRPSYLAFLKGLWEMVATQQSHANDSGQARAMLSSANQSLVG